MFPDCVWFKEEEQHVSMFPGREKNKMRVFIFIEKKKLKILEVTQIESLFFSSGLCDQLMISELPEEFVEGCDPLALAICCCLELRPPAQRCPGASGRDASGCGGSFCGLACEVQVGSELRPGVELVLVNDCISTAYLCNTNRWKVP